MVSCKKLSNDRILSILSILSKDSPSSIVSMVKNSVVTLIVFDKMKIS
jgi:hypothetical protein